MSVAACADLVQKGDPDRFLSTMAAPVAAREALFPLYAFNLEVARAPWVTAEPMIAEMRLQWWKDALDEIAEGAAPRAHEVVQPLAEVVRRGMPVDPLLNLIEARRRDILRAPFEENADLVDYLDATGGNLMWAAALAVGGAADGQSAIRAVGKAAALASWFQAVPALEASGQRPLPNEALDAISALAAEGLSWIADARPGIRRLPKRARPALNSAWLAVPVLKRARKDPGAVRAGRLDLQEVRRRWRLMRLAATGRILS